MPLHSDLFFFYCLSSRVAHSLPGHQGGEEVKYFLIKGFHVVTNCLINGNKAFMDQFQVNNKNRSFDCQVVENSFGYFSLFYLILTQLSMFKSRN